MPKVDDGGSCEQCGHPVCIHTDHGCEACEDPVPVGGVEIAQRLGVERKTVAMWNLRGLLPEPRWTVSGNPAWEWDDIEEWARRTGRLG